MLNARDLLLELGVEEIPAGELTRSLGELPALVVRGLEEARLAHGEVTVWGTPRRLAVRVLGVAERQADLEETLTGPPERVAYDGEGNATKAAQKFAEKVGVPLGELIMRAVVEDRAASPDEERQLLAEERAAVMAEAMARLGNLDMATIPAPYNQIIGDLLTVAGLK